MRADRERRGGGGFTRSATLPNTSPVKTTHRNQLYHGEGSQDAVVNVFHRGHHEGEELGESSHAIAIGAMKGGSRRGGPISDDGPSCNEMHRDAARHGVSARVQIFPVINHWRTLRLSAGGDMH